MSLDRLERQVALHEGLRLKPYTDSTGHQTIGYGLNLDEGITQKEAEYLLRSRLLEAIQDLQTFPFWTWLNEARAYVVIDMRYNLGHKTFRDFKSLIDALNAQQYHRAAAEMKDSRWYRQVKSRGDRLIQMMITGKHYDD